ncbi:MAG TPA: PEP-CTERM sorting domain-containing protein [Terriglobales bacterium]
MSTRGVFFAVAVSCVLSLSALAQQQNNWIYNLNDTCTEPNPMCGTPSSGFLGLPASGNADFTQFGIPLTYTFQTAAPLSWSNNEFGYFANFGYGGSFILAGPDGTFNGVVTSGSSEEGEGGEVQASVTVSFSGYWTSGQYDGEYSAGFAQVSGNYDQPGNPTTITLQMSTTPEPGTLALFGSGLFGLAAVRRCWK